MMVVDLYQALLSAEARHDPYPVYAALRRIGPVVEVTDGFLIATAYATVDEVLRDGNFGVERVPLIADQTSLLTMNPPDHTRVRRLMAGTFTARRVFALREAIQRQAVTLIEAMRANGNRADLMADFAYRLPVNVICELLGIPEKDRTWFRSVAADGTVTLEGSATPEELDAARSAGELLREYFKHLIKQQPPGLITDLAAAGELREGELLGNLSLLLIAGFETTTNLIGNGVMTLLEHPDHLAAMGDPVPYVEEFLRYDSPVQLTSRIALAPTVLNGQPVAEGTAVVALIGSANRDEARFADADRFDPARPDNMPISFGAGAHFCLGAALARLEGQIAFPLLLRHLPGLRLDGTPVRRSRLVLRGYESLPVAWN